MDSAFITWSHKFVQGITVEAGAAGNTDLEGAAVDTGNYQSVAIVVSFGPIVSGAATYIKAQQSADSGFSSPQDITGTKQVVADTQSNEVFIIDIIRRDYETYPYLRVHVDRATQAATCAALYILYDIRVTPATQSVGINVEQWKDVSVGTA
jgi:hypothetical protein